MGSRGPLPKKSQRATAARTKAGQRLRPLPDDADAIFRRLAREIDGLTRADAALLEDTARWVAIAKSAYGQLGRNGLDDDDSDDAAGNDGAPLCQALSADAVNLALTVTDTAHGNRQESRKNPLLIVLRTASEQIRANAQQLGATPLARARLPEPETETPSLAEILFANVIEHG